MNNGKRMAHFTSSKASKLLKTGKGMYGFGAPAITYIEEKKIEKRIGSCLDVGAYSQSIAWGSIMEIILFEAHLGFEYKHACKDTFLHPDPEIGKYWSGSTDFIVARTMISEAKCYERKKFAQYTDCLLKGDLQAFRKDFAEEYWQIISNCIIHQVDIGEAITYMPYKSELEKIRELIEDTNILERNDLDPWKFRFITEKPINDLHWIADDGYYKNVNKFTFEVPEHDKNLLTERMEKANLLLNEIQIIKS